MRNWLLIHIICWSVQGAIPQRDWAVREMGPGTFRNTSKMMNFFFSLERKIQAPLRNMFLWCSVFIQMVWRIQLGWTLWKNINSPCYSQSKAKYKAGCCVITGDRTGLFTLSVNFFSISVIFSSSSLWTAIRVVFIPRTRRSSAQTGMISNGFLWTGNKTPSDTTSGLVSINNWLPTVLLPLRIHLILRKKFQLLYLI